METLKDNIEYSNKLQGIINQNNVRLTSSDYVWNSSVHIFSGKEILETHEFNWFWGKYIEDKENGPRHIQYLKYDPVTRKSIRSEIAEKLNCSEENIRLLDNKNIAHVEPPQERVGEVGNSFIFNQYNVDYKYAKNLKPIITDALLF